MALDMDGGTVTKKVVKSSAGNLFAARVTNTNAALRWFQIHNKATAPAGNDVPILFVPIGPSTGIATISTDLLAGGDGACSAGVSWAISTTAATFTDGATANEHSVVVRFG